VVIVNTWGDRRPGLRKTPAVTPGFSAPEDGGQPDGPGHRVGLHHGRRGPRPRRSHDFFALKDHVFRHLVEEKGFRTFALEAPWSTGSNERTLDRSTTATTSSSSRTATTSWSTCTR
jgi:hypothetical protein